MSSIADAINPLIHTGRVVGIQGVQGCGKTTVCKDIQATCLSIDDFYLPNNEIEKLFAQYGDVYRFRGNPGSHDVRWLTLVLTAWKRGEDVTVPVYDKTCHDGRGDRVGRRHIPNDGGTLVVEGWMIGFRPVGNGSVVDEALKEYEAAFDCINTLFVLVPPYIDIVYKWRCRDDMKEDIQSFIDMYMPTYRTYLPILSNRHTMTIFILLDEMRCMKTL